LDPNSDAIFMVRGNLARISGNLEQAEGYYLQALENDADESVVYEAIAFLYLEKEQFKKGIFYLKKALDFDINNQSAIDALSAYSAEFGKPEEALPYYTQFLDNNPYNVTAWINYGLALEG